MTVFDNIVRILASSACIFLSMATWNGSYTFFGHKVDSKQTTLLFKVFTSFVYIVAILVMVDKFLTV